MMQIYEKKNTSEVKQQQMLDLSSLERPPNMCIEHITFFIFHQLNFEFRRDQISFRSRSRSRII